MCYNRYERCISVAQRHSRRITRCDGQPVLPTRNDIVQSETETALPKKDKTKKRHASRFRFGEHSKEVRRAAAVSSRPSCSATRCGETILVCLLLSMIRLSGQRSTKLITVGKLLVRITDAHHAAMRSEWRTRYYEWHSRRRIYARVCGHWTLGNVSVRPQGRLQSLQYIQVLLALV